MTAPTEVEQGEFARFFSTKYRGLVSYRRDGHILIKRIGDGGFLPFLQKKDEIPLDEWIARKQQEISVVPAWCLQVSALPSIEELDERSSDSVVETPTGYAVEPDGTGPDGVPSWLRCLGLI